jgi:hypothetical protein
MFLLLGIIILICTSCKDSNLPSSVTIRKNEIIFSLMDKSYNEVHLGTDIIGKWQNFEMKKIDSLWLIKFINPHKSVQYKFLINRKIWIRDPLNKKKIKLELPYQGYNSIIYLE